MSNAPQDCDYTRFGVNKQYAQKYSKSELSEGTYYLAFRDIRSILEPFPIGRRAIDYGCGTGRSTRFLRMLGYDTIGVDISKEMLEQANALDNVNHYLLIKNAKIPILNNTCDLIFASFVICTISTKKEMQMVFKEIHRCLSSGGVFIAVTAEDKFYQGNWLSYNVDFEGNKNLKSGDPARFDLKDLGIEFINYYWTHKDYCEIAESASLKVVDRLLPLGKASDHIPWVSETKKAPYATYVFQK